ncbi:MAG: hypothetical protein V7640_2703 [Betaproteobacteria bacterium]
MSIRKLATPRRACDCHMHIFDSRFPLAQSAHRNERDAPAAEYRKVQQRLGLKRLAGHARCALSHARYAGAPVGVAARHGCAPGAVRLARAVSDGSPFLSRTRRFTAAAAVHARLRAHRQISRGPFLSIIPGFVRYSNLSIAAAAGPSCRRLYDVPIWTSAL